MRTIINDFTACKEGVPESDYSVQSGYEDHIYQKLEEVPVEHCLRDKEESGFFSYESNAPVNSLRFTANIREISEEPSDFDNSYLTPLMQNVMDCLKKTMLTVMMTVITI